MSQVAASLMRGARMKQRKTDTADHSALLLVAAFGVAFASGMRIATEAPERS